MNTFNNSEKTPAKILYRFLAMLYDAFLVLALLFLAFAAITPLLTEASDQYHVFTSIYLLVIIFLFYAWFWTHGGQTLGMRTWRLRIEQNNGASLTWRHAFFRFLSALPGWFVFLIGCGSFIQNVHWPFYLTWVDSTPKGLLFSIGCGWLIIDNMYGNWRDRITETHIVRLSKNPVRPNTTEGSE